MNIRRKFTFHLTSVSYFAETPPSLFETGRKKLPKNLTNVKEIILSVALPKRLQRIKKNPGLAQKLLEDIPELSVMRGGLPCGSGKDFAKQLVEDKVTVGHAFGHVLAFFQGEVFRHFEDDREFRYTERELTGNEIRNLKLPSSLRRNCTHYQILMFCSGNEPPPAEYFGLEGIVIGYFNALFINDESFSIRDRVGDFKKHRTEKIPLESPDMQKSVVKSGFMKHLSARCREAMRSVMLIFTTNP